MEVPSLQEYETLLAEVKELRVMVGMMCDRLTLPKTLKVSDICKIENVSRSQIMGKQAYLLPYNGKSQYPDGSARWDLDVYFKWRSIPIEKRKRTFEAQLENERKMLL